ncbi:MAG: hemerythrin domain-containing protein [Hyphomicrobiales bacterium]
MAQQITAMADEFRAHLSRQHTMCDRLESLADSLPNEINVQECLYVAQSLLPTVVTAHRFEEERIFPALKQAPHAPTLDETLDRLGFEHMGDEQYAEEISLALKGYVTDRRSHNPETMAWMLRGFFDSLRRHIAFEREHVLPLLEKARAA